MKLRAIAICLILIGNIVSAEISDYPFYYSDHQNTRPNHILKEGEHELWGKSGDGIIEFENGAQFKALSDSDRVMTWDFYDHIVITPNPYPFREGPYYAINLDKGSDWVCVEYWNSPVKENIKTNFLWRIDRDNQEIILINNSKVKTRWKIDEDDFQELVRHWLLGDSVLIGKNDTYCSWFNKHQYILISYKAANYNLYVRATPMPL